MLLQSGSALQQIRKPSSLFPSRSLTARRMVLTTPESIIEQASTKKLLDDLIDESVRTSAKQPIMMQFDPSSNWIWKRWKGTIFSETWDSCVSKMLYATAVYFICRTYPGVKEHLSGFNVLWGQLLSVTTFTLTFFVNQSYALWRKCYELSRRLQGRLHDLDMTLAAHAQRRPPANPTEHSTYTPASRQVLELVSRYVRLFNLLTYASFTRSHRPILTPRGMRRLVERGLMTPQEREILIDAELPATQRHNAVLLWIIRIFVEGREAGHFLGGAGFEEQFMEKIHVTRAQYGAIGDELQGRMPLAYAHIVQVLVDLILYMYPLKAFSSGMSPLVSVLGTGLLTVSYQGLFDLAKQFLDPYDNESYGRGEDPLVVDTLIAETNAGSVRWMNGLEEMPVSSQRIKDGELSDYLLPVRGYTVEELKEMEEEKLQRERELQERREREEAERLKQEQEEEKLRQAAEAMVNATMSSDLVRACTTSNATYFLTNGESKPNLRIPSLLSDSTISKGEDVAGMVNTIATRAPDWTLPLIPDGTALAEPHIEEPINGEEVDEGPNGATYEYDEEQLVFSDEVEGEDGEEDEFFDVIEDWGDEGGYVHSFDAFDPYKDLPWHEEVGPDGQEIRLSQMLADEIWEEEIEAQKEKETPASLKEYIQKVAEIEDMKESELLETQEILSASPGADSMPVKDDKDDAPKYDQTKLDGISQLWGLPPDDLSELPGYKEPPVPQSDFDGISQLWGESVPSATAEYRERPEVEQDSSFTGISQLWGEAIEDSKPDELLSSSATCPVSASDSRSLSDTAGLSVGTRSLSDSGSLSVGTRSLSDAGTLSVLDGSRGGIESVGESRLSQMLADEVWVEEMEAEPMEEPVTFEDYKKQVAEILEAEEEELLETEAILNAPPAANYLDVPEKEHESKLKPANITEQDDLAVLEMDPPSLDATSSATSSEPAGDSIWEPDEPTAAESSDDDSSAEGSENQVDRGDDGTEAKAEDEGKPSE